MARKRPSLRDEAKQPADQPTPPLVGELLELKLSDGQRQTILKYAKLPGHLSDRLTAKGTTFSLDELDELLDHVELAAYRARGNEKQKVLRIVARVANLLGSIIDPTEMPESRPADHSDTVYQIKVTLEEIGPPIWRRIQTKDCTLAELHALIQVTMGWEFEHLYRFDIGGVQYADLDMMNDDDIEDVGTLLSEVLPPGNRRPRFLYEYDFGDSWIHQLIVEERLSPVEGVKYPICVAGQRACPPEDCGGPWRYSDFVEVVSNPDHPEHEETLDWVGDEFDPERFDLEAVNRQLRRM